MKKIFTAICASLILAVGLAAGSKKDNAVRGNLAQLKGAYEEIDLAQANAAEKGYFDYVYDTYIVTGPPSGPNNGPIVIHGHYSKIGTNLYTWVDTPGSEE